MPLVAVLEFFAFGCNTAEQISLCYLGDAAGDARFGIEDPEAIVDPRSMDVMWLNVAFGFVLSADDAKGLIVDYMPDEWPLIEYTITLAISLAQIFFLPYFAPDFDLPLWFWYVTVPLEICNELTIIILARLEYPPAGENTRCAKCCTKKDGDSGKKKGERPQLRDTVHLRADKDDFWRACVPDFSIGADANFIVIADDRSASPFKLRLIGSGIEDLKGVDQKTGILDAYFDEDWLVLVERSASSGETNQHALTKQLKALDKDGDGLISPCELIEGLKQTPELLQLWLRNHVSMLARTARSIFIMFFFVTPSFVRPPWMLTSLEFTIAMVAWIAVFDLRTLLYSSIWINLCWVWVQDAVPCLGQMKQRDMSKLKNGTFTWFFFKEKRAEAIGKVVHKMGKMGTLVAFVYWILSKLFDVLFLHADSVMAICVFSIMVCLDSPIIFNGGTPIIGGISGAYRPMPWCEIEDGVDRCPEPQKVRFCCVLLFATVEYPSCSPHFVRSPSPSPSLLLSLYHTLSRLVLERPTQRKRLGERMGHCHWHSFRGHSIDRRKPRSDGNDHDCEDCAQMGY